MPVAACKDCGKSPHNAAEPSPSCNITMVGASDGAGPIMRYSRSLSPIWRKPAGERVVMRIAAFAPRRERAFRQHFDFYRAATSRLRRRFIVSQLEPLDLAGRGFRQGVDGLDPARIFPDADLLLDVFFQRLVEAISPGAGAQHDKRLGLEQTFAIGLGHHGRLKHRGMGDQRALDLERRYPDAGNLEHVVTAAAEGVAPVGVANVFVAGAGPMSLESAPAFAALIPVAFARRGRIDQKFADFTIGYVAARLVDKPHLVARHRPAGRAISDVAWRIRQEDMQQFGRADAVEDIDTKARLPGIADRLRQRFARRHADAKAFAAAVGFK